MKRILETIARRITTPVLALSVVLFLTPYTDAASFRLIDIQCIKPQENGPKGDKLRLTIKTDTGLTQTHRQFGVKKGFVWGFDQTMTQCNKSLTVNLTELDSAAEDGIHFRDENLGTVTLKAEPLNTIRTATFKAEGAHYVMRYQFVASPQREMIIVSVKCNVTQEKDADGDELRLRIKADGGKEITLSKNGVKKGTTWTVNRKVAFFTQVRLTLVENDGFGIHFRDETLGTANLTATPGLSDLRTVRFTGHGADYVITYRMGP